MTYYDVFNGDADGICALQQLRLASPLQSVLVTGVKRDIALMARVTAEAGDEITVLDISFQKNRQDVFRNLALGAHIRYFDHHNPGTEALRLHPNLVTHINTSAKLCTSLLVDQYLQSRFALWAAVGAFGDNLEGSARQHLQSSKLTFSQIEQLRGLGICLNYNGYGASIDDLYYYPDVLFQSLQQYENPLHFIRDEPIYAELDSAYKSDMAKAAGLTPEAEFSGSALFILPEAAWARRVSGVMANRLAQESPERAHALLSKSLGGGYLVSVRAPLCNKTGADLLCGAFPNGGGRQGAAGINHLPEDCYDDFLQRFQKQYCRQ